MFMEFDNYLQIVYGTFNDFMSIELLSGFSIGLGDSIVPIVIHLGDLVIFVLCGSMLYKFLVPTFKN